MKDPIHTSNIYVGVAWFCHRSFLFFPSPPPLLASSSSSAVSGGDAMPEDPGPSGAPWQRVLAGIPIPQTDSHPRHWLQGFLSPLSHTRKWNFLKILIQLGGRSHLLAPCPWQQHCWGLGKWHKFSHPPSFLMSGVRAGKGNSSILALTGAFPVISLCLIQPFFLRNLGRRDDLPMAPRPGEIWACSWSSGYSQALWKMKAIHIFLPHLRNESSYLHVACGLFKAGTGKEMGGLKPTSVSQMSTTNPWACFTLRNKDGMVGLGKELMISLLHLSTTKNCLKKGYRDRGKLYSALPSPSQGWKKCRDWAGPEWKTKILEHSFRNAKFLP